MMDVLKIVWTQPQVDGTVSKISRKQNKHINKKTSFWIAKKIPSSKKLTLNSKGGQKTSFKAYMILFFSNLFLVQSV